MFIVENVTFRYGSVVALDNISLQIEEGKRIALLGANGSGKSTLLRMLDGLCFPDSGIVSFRNDMLDGPGGRQILCEDPSGNPIELFQPR